ncbi:MAG: SOUL family heme-binding protein [Flavobacteriia bacterium]|jgi:hypothetical protein|nr:heme-binding protein [Cryomorphaceae bacterium]
MKTILIVTSILLGIMILAQAFIYTSTNSTEQHKYVVLKKFEEFEVRQYAPAMFSSVKMVSDSYETISSTGFRTLAGYIFGGNDKNEKIAMTSPVVMEIGDTTRMSFMVPSDMKKEDLPKPNNGRIYFEEQEQKIMAAIEFGGWADDEKIEEYTNKLKANLKANGLSFTGKFSYLGYNPPYQVVGRRNEIVVELVEFVK